MQSYVARFSAFDFPLWPQHRTAQFRISTPQFRRRPGLQPGGRPKLRADVNLLGLRAASQAGGMATMNQALEHVTIVGGGTAGWLTAMMLNTYLNGRGKKQNVNITL